MVSYPVSEILPELKQKLAQEKIVILQAPPGAGKSTIVPLELLNEPWLNNKKIIVLQPRRLAARAVASRMAELKNEKLGEQVGYRIRFEKVVGKNTRIEVVTEGILTRLLQHDNELKDIGLVIFDEFHERSLHADLALTLCYQIQQYLREDLRLLIMSATLDGEKIASVLNHVSIVTSQGRQFPVDLKYESIDKKESIVNSVCKVISKALREQVGDILVFLPGAGEINRVNEELNSKNVEAVIYPLYGDLPFQKQREAILPHANGLRKIILSTAIAETSLTIEGITTVVDSGLSRMLKFDPRSGLTKLETVKVTRDAADQRAGRAGRLGPGVCYRLWTKAEQQFLQPSRQPEIMETDLAPLMLELFNWGSKADELNWITPPPTGAVNQAIELLEQLGAVKENKITTKGKEMLQLPAHPRIAHMLLSVDSEREKSLACDLAALLEERDPMMKEAGVDISLRIEWLRRQRNGEHTLTDKTGFDRIEKVAQVWRKTLNLRADHSFFADTDIGKLLMEVYPERIAKQTEKFGSRYKLANGRVARLQQDDNLIQRSWIVIASMDMGTTEGKIFLAAPVDENDLHPHTIERKNIYWDVDRGMISSTIEKCVGSLVVTSKPMMEIDETTRIKVLCNALREEGLTLLNWDEPQLQWQARVASLRLWFPEEGWPDVSDQALLASVEDWLTPFLSQVSKRSDFRKIDIQNIVSGILPWELQNKLDKLAPEKLQVPSGAWIKLEYSSTGDSPVLKVRLQELFGLAETPTVGGGKIKIVLNMLSPGYKPVQVTQDLKSFWNNTYPVIRKELRIRYPKHHWPDDPWTAQAVRGVKRR
ncbi:MAG: ATP-dependent helicase HrpB [Bacteroidetes bacterium]|nr:ATP-dependent helicase HrpB [Bacteroidota bacterium]